MATSLLTVTAWEALVHAGVLRAAFFPPPTNIATTLAGLAASGELWFHGGTTLGRLIASFLLALIPGTVLGLAMGWWIRVRMAADPLVRLLFPIPSLAFFPVVIFYLGLSEWGLLLTAAMKPIKDLIDLSYAAAAVKQLGRR